MKPNTPMKITMISHITSWCSQSISAASFDAGVWKYQAMACAAPDAARPVSPARTARIFVDLIFAFVPDSDLQSLRQLGGQLDARLGVQMPPDLQFLALCPQQHARAVSLVLLQAHHRAVRR